MFELMQSGLLSQLIPQKKLNSLIEAFEMDKGVTKLSTKKLIDTLICGAVFQKNTFRDMEQCYGTPRSTLSEALSRRSHAFFQELCSVVVSELIQMTPQRKMRRDLREILALDSTLCHVHGCLARRFANLRQQKTIAGIKLHAVWSVENEWIQDFSISGYRRNDGAVAKTMRFSEEKMYVFDRAYVDATIWLKVQRAGSHFVTRLKKSGSRLKMIHRSVLSGKDDQVGVLYDGKWNLSDPACYRAGLKPGEIEYRHIIYRDPITKMLFDFVTSDFEIEAQTVADIYKKRWSVELLFRWLKGHLNLRRFGCKNLNAIKIQMSITILVQLLVRLKRLSEEIIGTNWDVLRALRNTFDRQIFETLLRKASQDYGPRRSLVTVRTRL